MEGYAWIEHLKGAEGIFATDLDQEIVYWSPSAEAIMGVRGEEAVGRKCYEIICGIDKQGNAVCMENCAVMKLLKNHQMPQNYDLLAKQPSGSRVHLNISTMFHEPSEIVVHLFNSLDGEKQESRADHVTDNLTARELEVLRMLATGLSTPEIAKQMNISPFTVRNHICSIESKLGVHSRLQAVVKSYKLGLLQPINGK